MKLSKLHTQGLKSDATVWSGPIEPGDLARLVESPAETLTAAGAAVPDGDLRVRLELPSTDRAKASGGVVIIILDDGTVIIIVMPVTVKA